MRYLVFFEARLPGGRVIIGDSTLTIATDRDKLTAEDVDRVRSQLIAAVDKDCDVFGSHITFTAPWMPLAGD